MKHVQLCKSPDILDEKEKEQNNQIMKQNKIILSTSTNNLKQMVLTL